MTEGPTRHSGGADAGARNWRDVLVAVDVGTSGARAAAFDLDGVRRLEVRRFYPTRTPHHGWAEQEPRTWWTAARDALAELVATLGTRRRIHAIGLTGQCPSVCIVDPAGRPIRPGLIYRDNRATTEALAIRERFGDAWIHARTGHLPSAFHIAPKLQWLRDHEPVAFGAAALALQPRDFVARELTGEPATDGSHAAATLAFNLRARAWDDELLAGLELPASLFPPVRPSWETLGTLLPSVAERVGLSTRTPVVLGGADSQACALGAGVIQSGPVSEMAGSSTCLNAVVAEPLQELLVTHYPHVVPGPFTTETGINTTGAAVAWVADLLYARRPRGSTGAGVGRDGAGRGGRATATDYERLDREAATVSAGADGLLAVPVLGDGERTDPDLRGAFTGLSLRHGRAAIARAVLEGVAFAIRAQLELLEAGGAPVTELRISGGGARLGTWNRVKADILGHAVVTVPGDAAVAGVAMLAGIGAGVYQSAEEAITRCVRLDPPIEPDPATGSTYEDSYAAYRALIDAAAIRRLEET
jgi:xylulokinase